ncbi:GNAT family N-acetyltransferase [Ectobacillus panaciterrae]|uniref:GNAT family N-acetyltransferase n=1 Tax=Ectobacillus panaciterrae TaxID=363872 RepID=UPI00040F05A8|nr:GNAT family N-acetyltransferase [Ectobacillus panaciterrae]
MKADLQLIYLIEELAANAWPAYIQQTLGQWRLRATFGITERANSVYTVGNIPNNDNWLQIVEEFYQSRSIHPCFYVSDASPSDLDGILEGKGYKKLDECFMMTAECAEIMDRVERNNRFTTKFILEADDAWIHEFILLGGFTLERHHAYSCIFSAIPFPKAFARIYENGETIGLGTVVVENGWACISNIVVHPAHQRKGVAAQLIRHLTEWAQKKGANGMYLQVIKNNIPAVTLYNKLGFVPISRHHYRTLQTF